MKTKRILIVLVISALLVSLLALVWIGILDIYHKNVDGDEDYLLYIAFTEQNRQQLMFYDVADRTNTLILPGWEIHQITVNMKNRLAFLSDHEGELAIYILDYPFIENTPVNITHDVPVYEYSPISWSPDGHYLAYATLQDDVKTLWVWDGQTRLPIHEYQDNVGWLIWSHNRYLAFVEYYNSHVPSYKGDPSEIFIWDGQTVAPVGQTPLGNDRYPAWSDDGQLAFLSEWEERKYGIFVWDGVSKINGVPDIKTYQNIAPDLTRYYSAPVWTSSNSLAFSAPVDSYLQIYEWNGETATNISQNPQFHNSGQSWRSDGYWTAVDTYSGKFYIRDAHNRTVYDNIENEGEVVVDAEWGQNGNLLYCAWSFDPNPSPGIAIRMWDGSNIIEIAKNVNMAMWRNGNATGCAR